VYSIQYLVSVNGGANWPMKKGHKMYWNYTKWN
jgi:hypothetical protein